MDRSSRQNATTALMSLEAAATSARGGFGCVFSSSDEYERALISERRAQGRYDHAGKRWPLLMFIGCSLIVAGSVLLLR
ncbi:MAG TPA: hypothetical protein VHB49_06485 [Bradyrhizobium sp.]|nr:hypothetical protein [Bradyrhizobium sp.]